MKIAILGAGLAGLGVAFALQRQGVKSIDVFDPNGIGGGASGVAAGVVHAYAGAQGKKTWQADAGMEATKRFIQGIDCIKARGLLRLALSDKQKKRFRKSAEAFDDVSWQEETLADLADAPGILIESALALDIGAYMQGLWKRCGATLHRVRVTSLKDLDGYDTVIVAMGAATNQLDACEQLPITPVKGQLLELKWPKGLTPLPYAVNSVGYIVQHQPDRCLVGATFEHEFATADPDLDFAVNSIMPRIAAVMPGLEGAEVLNVFAGVRASSPGHRPIMEQLDERTWVLAGLGSKGLLHHAWMAEELAMKLTSA